MGSIQRVDRTKPWLARYRGPDGRQHSKTFARKVDAERWLKVSEAETLTGQWVDPAAGEQPFGPYAEEWIAYKRSRVGESTATNTEALLRARVLPEFGGKTLKQITTPVVGPSNRDTVVTVLDEVQVTEADQADRREVALDTSDSFPTIRRQRFRGRKRRSKSPTRDTVPTIDLTGTSRSPSTVSPSPPSAVMTSWSESIALSFRLPSIKPRSWSR